MPANLLARNNDVRGGKFDGAVKRLADMDEAQLKKIYDQRDFEKI
ncbi:hypothetical protein SDC9_179686 [bioreactor metagenome]|uniref:Uncharacterized protein n=1 Tax=bioreactor metagenome TaxID=1076179 RepID=A0A645H0J7_9ZZZZ